jgi:hypothetical protein
LTAHNGCSGSRFAQPSWPATDGLLVTRQGSQLPRLVGVWLVGAWLSGCADAALDIPRSRASELELEVTPALERGLLPIAFRARIDGLTHLSGPLYLFDGLLSEHQQARLRQAEVSQSLGQRALPLRFWRGAAAEGWWVQPQRLLTPGRQYTLAVGGSVLIAELQAAAAPDVRWRRWFPPPASRISSIAVYCGVEQRVTESVVLLEPGAVPAQLWPGVLGHELPGCMTVSAASNASLHGCAPPPELFGALVEPGPFFGEGAGESVGSPGGCSRTLLGGHCVSVEDDRVLVLAPSEDLLWVLFRPQLQVVVTPKHVVTPLVRGLASDQSFGLAGFVVSSSGVRREFSSVVETQAARRHVVLNEVLANPLGQEPGSEWIEIVNDADTPASLSGLFLEDSGGSIALPEASLEPGEHVLLVGEGYTQLALDVPAVSGTKLLTLPELGTRGLTNSGEALLLVGSEGVVSRFPILPSKQAGVSVARRSPSAADDEAGSFAAHAAPGASPGAANLLAE